ncbi:MAG: choice-of-anchor I family protein [Algibacter sp.]|uniref:choice-of-anchor I family protein n=1 Tax=Algibacter sp. TaxID=1872428 RepID=UPI002632E091|nr:choice-of-anchor I family protein [Algibacter sp.]MDG1730693.1 choice-of-anchor I family protein [Algibacter sp.]MDG2177644.1 choice-of-anchor I family protein [Algibacter sp.]
MKFKKLLISAVCVATIFSCQNDDDNTTKTPINTEVNFQYKTTINIGGEGASEISAYDAITKKLFTVNVESNQISVNNISNLDATVLEEPIDLSAFGAPNSVAIYDGKLAVAVEADPKQNPGKILVYNTSDNTLLNQYTVGALPDMVTFSKDGKLIISANEGEPNDDYTVDPEGSISVIDLSDDSVTTLDFTSFNSQESSLEAQGFRVFGPEATLAQDVEPEYITVSEDSNTAWVSLQENNGIAKVNLITKTIEAIYPLGYKDYNITGNEIDASDEDGVTALKNWPVLGMYQPDAITSANIGGIEYIFSANEGDSRDYDGFSEEERVDDLTLDETVYPFVNDFQNEINLGRLKTTLTLGDADNDGDVDQIYSFGARSFSVWSGNGNLLYDSGNSIAKETLAETPSRFNDGDKRSDDKGAEPEAVEILNIGNERYILFVGLERNDQVMVYDVTNPTAPKYMAILSHTGDEAPEGLFVIPAIDSPNGKDLLVVSYEDSGTVSFYENIQ